MVNFIFIGGMGRSGTSLLRCILDSHPHIAAGPEFDTLIAILEQYRETKSKILTGRATCYLTIESARVAFHNLIYALLAPYAESRGKRFLVEKTPSNLWHFTDLAELFPRAKFIHLVRDGRDVICSHLEVGQRLLKLGRHGDRRKQRTLFEIPRAAAMWSKTVLYGWNVAGPQSLLSQQGRCITIRYCDIIRSTEDVCRSMCDFIGVGFNEKMLTPETSTHDSVVDGIWVVDGQDRTPISSSRIHRWMTDMPNIHDRIIFAALAQQALALYEFERDTSWILRDYKGEESALADEVKTAWEVAQRLSAEIEHEEERRS